jgi:hypothetical protein
MLRFHLIGRCHLGHRIEFRSPGGHSGLSACARNTTFPLFRSSPGRSGPIGFHHHSPPRQARDRAGQGGRRARAREARRAGRHAPGRPAEHGRRREPSTERTRQGRAQDPPAKAPAPRPARLATFAAIRQESDGYRPGEDAHAGPQLPTDRASTAVSTSTNLLSKQAAAFQVCARPTHREPSRPRCGGGRAGRSRSGEQGDEGAACPPPERSAKRVA